MKKIPLLFLSFYILIFSCKKNDSSTINEISDDTLSISDIEKIFEDHRERNKGNDSIRKTLGVNDNIIIEAFHPVWKDAEGKYDTEVSILHEIIRIGNDERRTIDAINYDMIITDRFDNELYRIRNVTYEEDMEANNIGTNYSHANFPTTVLPYNKNQNSLLEKLRTYHYKQLKVNTEIKAILFVDGNVLKAQ